MPSGVQRAGYPAARAKQHDLLLGQRARQLVGMGRVTTDGRVTAFDPTENHHNAASHK